MNNRLALCILSLSFVLIGCATANGAAVATTPENPAVTEPSNKAATENRISMTGTVKFIEINGGFWGIIGDDGKHYDPMDLDPQFQKDGLHVHIEAVPETDMMSSRMWGTMIRLIHIETLKPD